MASIMDLPLEIVDYIAVMLDDHSRVNLSCTCMRMNQALSETSGSWKRLFVDKFDAEANLGSLQIVRQYKAFRQGLRITYPRGDGLHLGSTGDERRRLIAIKLLIKGEAEETQGQAVADQIKPETYAGAKEADTQPQSKNLVQLSRFCKRSSLYLDFCKSTRPLSEADSDLLMVQVLLVHELFNNTANQQDYGLADSQMVAYASTRDEPVLLGTGGITINFKLLRSVINVIYSSLIYSELKMQLFQQEQFALYPARVPRPWTTAPRPGVAKIGKNWIGMHAAAENMMKLLAIRQDPEWQNAMDVMDVISTAFDGLQFCYIDEPPEDYPLREEIERHLQCAGHPSRRYWDWASKGTRETRRWARKNRAKLHAELVADFVANPQKRQAPLWYYQFLLDQEIENRRKDEEPGTSTGTIMFKCATGRPNPGRRLEPVVDERVGVGFLQPLPTQQGIPGWMRFSMLTFCLEAHGISGGNAAYEALMSETEHDVFWRFLDSDNVSTRDANCPTGSRLVEDAFGYEGIVLPGGQVCLGRWWQVDPDSPGGMMEEQCVQPSGPFMIWRIGDQDIAVPALIPPGFGPPPPSTL